MSTSQLKYADLHLSDDQVAAFSQRIYDGVRREVVAYAAIDDPQTDRDFSGVNRENVLLFFRCLAEDRQPTARELGVVEQSARRRLWQAIPLEAIFHSYRVGVRVMWECLLEVSPQRDHGRLAVLALEYADRVSTAAAQAYVEERQRLRLSRHEAARLLLTRVIREEVDETAALAEAATLGLDFLVPHSVLVAAAARSTTSSDLTLAAVQGRLQAGLDRALAVLLSTGLVAAVPAEDTAAAEALLLDQLPSLGNGAAAFTVGVGAARPGIGGLAGSYHEALRARAVGAILHPELVLHRYTELTLFDLFKEGEPMDAFVREALGPLLDLDTERLRRATETLTALFSSALNRKQAAFQLGVHQNTLSYRIRRIEQLLGNSFISGEFCFRVDLALRLLPLTLSRRQSLSARPPSSSVGPSGRTKDAIPAIER